MSIAYSASTAHGGTTNADRIRRGNDHRFLRRTGGQAKPPLDPCRRVNKDIIKKGIVLCGKGVHGTRGKGGECRAKARREDEGRPPIRALFKARNGPTGHPPSRKLCFLPHPRIVGTQADIAID